jgi:Zn-finger nucleic acid-binding protein
MPRCPSCFTPLTRVVENEIKSAVCPNCFGTWLNAGALLRKAQGDARAFAGGTPTSDEPSLTDLAEIVQTSDSRDVLRCGECEKPMSKERFHPMIPVQVDRCHRCNTIWLDAGELPLIRRLYAELMNSTDPEIQRRRDKVGSVAAQLQGRKFAQQEAKQNLERDHDNESAFDLLEHLLDSVIR